MRFRPLHGVALVLAVVGAILGGEFLFAGGAKNFQRVSPDTSGRITIPVADLQPLQVRFYRFLNRGNQEVKFFVGRDERGGLAVAFDASENDFKRHRGFRADGAWMVNNKCEISTKLVDVNEGRSGCGPTPLRFRLEGERVVLAENDILEGWRYFR
ncbi:MAG: Fe-S-containing protein [Thermoanaerobaculia bacterium]